jgi:hypothetical protein
MVAKTLFDMCKILLCYDLTFWTSLEISDVSNRGVKVAIPIPKPG